MSTSTLTAAETGQLRDLIAIALQEAKALPDFPALEHAVIPALTRANELAAALPTIGPDKRARLHVDEDVLASVERHARALVDELQPDGGCGELIAGDRLAVLITEADSRRCLLFCGDLEVAAEAVWSCVTESTAGLVDFRIFRLQDGREMRVSSSLVLLDDGVVSPKSGSAGPADPQDTAGPPHPDQQEGHDEITAISEHAMSARVEIPVTWLRRAQCAVSEYSDYGSNDDEHDLLLEIIDQVSATVGDHGYGTWTFRFDITGPLSDAQLEHVKARIPSNLADTLEVTFLGEEAREHVGLTYSHGVHGTVANETLGVAQQAARELHGALKTIDSDVVPARWDLVGSAPHTGSSATNCGRGTAPEHSTNPTERTDQR